MPGGGLEAWGISTVAFIIGAVVVILALASIDQGLLNYPVVMIPILGVAFITGKVWYFLEHHHWGRILLWGCIVFMVLFFIIGTLFALSRVDIGDINSAEGAIPLFAAISNALKGQGFHPKKVPVQAQSQHQTQPTTQIQFPQFVPTGTGPIATHMKLGIMYHGTPSYENACDIYFNNRWKPGLSDGVYMTPVFSFAQNYSGTNGFIIVLSISPHIELEQQNSKVYRAPIPNGTTSKYYRFKGITPIRILDYNQMDVTPSKYN